MSIIGELTIPSCKFARTDTERGSSQELMIQKFKLRRYHAGTA